MVDLDTSLGEQLLDIAVGQAEAQVPADRQHDHVGWEAEAGEGGARRNRPAGAVSGSHGRSLHRPDHLTANATEPSGCPRPTRSSYNRAQPTTTRSSGSKLVKRLGRLRNRLARLRLA